MFFRFCIGLICVLFVTVHAPQTAHAQEWPTENSGPAPELPTLLKDLEKRGIQVFYMGLKDNVPGWVIIQNGVPTYFYQPPNSSHLIQGLMFNEAGKNVTIEQLQNLQFREGDVLGQLVKNITQPQQNAQQQQQNAQVSQAAQNFAQNQLAQTVQSAPQRDPNSPAEVLFASFQQSNWVSFGSASAPKAYVVIDPDCPHCQKMMREMRPLIEAGQIELRVIPIGFNSQSKKVGSLMLAGSNPSGLFYSYIDGNTNNEILKEEINTAGVDSNLGVVRRWELDATPFVVYRDGVGEIKLIRGIPKDPASFVADLARN